MVQPECVVCHKGIAYRFVLCVDCIEQYGRNRKSWPDWLKFLVRDERRLARSDAKLRQHEASVSALGGALFYAMEAKLYGS